MSGQGQSAALFFVIGSRVLLSSRTYTVGFRAVLPQIFPEFAR